MIEPPGLRAAWWMRMRMREVPLIVGPGREEDRERTVEGGPAVECVQARIVGGVLSGEVAVMMVVRFELLSYTSLCEGGHGCCTCIAMRCFYCGCFSTRHQ